MSDDFDIICERGRQAAASLDTGRWLLGALALQVQGVYGQKQVATFAREVNVPRSRLYEYRQVAAFYAALPDDYRDTHPMLSWSHYRLAMRRCDTAVEAVHLLDTANDEGWTADELSYRTRPQQEVRWLFEATSVRYDAQHNVLLVLTNDPRRHEVNAKLQRGFPQCTLSIRFNEEASNE
jgi:hypothetical protein